jgi:hypothetical protein
MEERTAPQKEEVNAGCDSLSIEVYITLCGGMESSRV